MPDTRQIRGGQNMKRMEPILQIVYDFALDCRERIQEQWHETMTDRKKFNIELFIIRQVKEEFQ